MMRVLTFAHGHGELQPGGGERAALSLHQWLQDRDDVEPVLVARSEGAMVGHEASFGAFRGDPRQILAAVPTEERFVSESDNLPLLDRMVDALIDRFAPDLVHVQHFAGWSLDLLALLDRRGVPVVMTLHDLWPVCHHEGKMVKTWGPLCHAASPAECARCFPQFSPGDFFLRDRMNRERLATVAAFVTPSHFLADRYRAWGLPAERLHVIDNPLALHAIQASPAATAKLATSAAARATVRFGFFGMLHRFKGVATLLEAVARLPDDVADRVRVEVYGAGLDDQEPAYRDRIADLVEAVGGTVTLHGGYANAEVAALMRGCDWVVVPSVWWENAPVVVQEAAAAGRPVLASAVGGLAETVGVTVPGLTVRPGDAAAWADAIAAVVRGEAVPVGTAEPPDPGLLVDRYVDVFKGVMRGARA